MSLIANIDRILERNQQLENDNQRLRDMALQAEDDRNQSVEVEVQRRLKSAAEDARNEIKNLRTQLARNDQRAQDADAEARGLLASTTEDLNNEIQDLQDRNLRLQNELLSTMHERDDLRRDLEIAERNLLQRPDDHSKVEQLEPIVARQVDEIQRHEKEILDLKVRLGTKVLQLDKVKKEKDQLQSTLDNANDKFKATLDDAINNAQCAAAETEVSLSQAKSDLEKEKRKRVRLKDQVKEMNERIQELEVECEELEARNGRLEARNGRFFWRR
jgi:chromosome segregation ATPase